ncbi:O-antigen ligase family protein [Flaviaesturariibacter amylovorans]|uniref:O-antigen ligase-related domain-containing protein n=1 Tax=Flaviaesturariibacter amylovorans TaxID=1084520 RepID=A0ABP8HEL7_9BACT
MPADTAPRITAAQKISLGHGLLFVASLPFERFYSQLLLLSLVAHTLIQVRRSDLHRLWRREVLLLQGVFWITLAATAWSSEKGTAFTMWERHLAFALFPLLLPLQDGDLRRATHLILRAFAVVNAAVVLYLYGDALAVIRFHGLPISDLFGPHFISHRFAEPIGLHATYGSLFCALSLTVVLREGLRERRRLRAAGWMLLASVLLAALVQLGSRSVLLATGLIVLGIVPFFLERRAARIRYLVVTVLLTGILAVAINRSDGLSQRLVTDLRSDLTTEGGRYSVADPRAARWALGWELVKASPLWGHGTGDEVALLKEKYWNARLYDSYLNELNAHNQYLSFAIRGGILGVLGYCGFLAFLARLAWRSRNGVFGAFVLLVAVTGVSENLLDVNKGIFFVAFFGSLFGWAALQEHEIKHAPGNPATTRRVFTGNRIPVKM